MTRKQYLSLAVIPLLALFLGLWVSSVRGPYHYGLNSDPEYPYLMNAINILLLTSPGHIDHPGTTLQVLLAGLFSVRHFATCALGGCTTLQIDILSNTEAYLHFANFAILSGISGLLFAIGVYVRKRTVAVFPAYLLQGAIFTFPIVLQSLGRVSPEPLIMILSLAYLTPFAVLSFQRMENGEPSEDQVTRAATISGLLLGVGFITKITFAPLGILVFALPGWRPKLRFLGAAAVAAFVCILPVLQKVPLILKWAQSLLVHSGQYGGGEVGLPSSQFLRTSAILLLDQEPFYAVWMSIALVAGLAVRSVRKELLLAVIGALVVLLATVKHPGARYLMPGMGLLAFTSVLVAGALRRSRVAIGIFAVMGVYCIIFVAGRMSTWTTGQVWYVAGVAKLDGIAKVEGKDCKTYHYYRSNDLVSSLIFGNEYASLIHSNVLASIYPAAIRYNTFAGRFDGFSGQDLTDVVISQIEEGQCVLVQGMSLVEQNWPAQRGLRRKVLGADGGETLSRVTAEKQAAPAYAEPPAATSIVVEAERLKAGNAVADTALYGAGIGVLTTPAVPAWAEIEVSLPVAGQYEIRARYASEGSRPIRLLAGRKLLIPDFCKTPTGGYFPPDQKWISNGVYALPAGLLKLRLESDGPFPHLDKIAFVPTSAGGAVKPK